MDKSNSLLLFDALSAAEFEIFAKKLGVEAKREIIPSSGPDNRAYEAGSEFVAIALSFTPAFLAALTLYLSQRKRDVEIDIVESQNYGQNTRNYRFRFSDAEGLNSNVGEVINKIASDHGIQASDVHAAVSTLESTKK